MKKTSIILTIIATTFIIWGIYSKMNSIDYKLKNIENKSYKITFHEGCDAAYLFNLQCIKNKKQQWTLEYKVLFIDNNRVEKKKTIHLSNSQLKIIQNHMVAIENAEKYDDGSSLNPTCKIFINGNLTISTSKINSFIFWELLFDLGLEHKEDFLLK